MMREIIFRGKDVETQKWVFGYFSECVEPMDEPVVLTYIKDIENNSFIVYPETAGQYTGMNDKNGSRIFEGDVLRQDGCSDFYIVFNERTSSLGWSFTDPIRAQGYIHQMTKYDMGRGEVCGNVHDNPELINGK